MLPGERKRKMLEILYEDKDLLAVVKPPGTEAQSSRKFEPDMVSLIRTYLAEKERRKISTEISTKPVGNRKVIPQVQEPAYVGVIHRLDKPVGGVMVYAKTPKAAAALSQQVSQGKMKKIYLAVVCGKPVDNQGSYVDYLLKNRQNNCAEIVDKSVEKSQEACLNYHVLGSVKAGDWLTQDPDLDLTLVEIRLLTGRYHQIRAQMARHGTPIVGDSRYGQRIPGVRRPLALWARSLTFTHPFTGEEITCEKKPEGGAFRLFRDII